MAPLHPPLDFNDELTLQATVENQVRMKVDHKIRSGLNYITIAANDLERSFGFYKDGLGFSTKGIKNDHALFNLTNGLKLVLYEKKEFLNLTGNPNQTLSVAGFIISHFAGSKEEVDIILQKALKAGAKRIKKTEDEPWCYAVNFTDLDGYQWEIVWEA